MFYQTFVTICAINIWQAARITGQQDVNLPPSPCPNVFQYRFDGNQLHGVIEVPSPPIEHQRVILQVTLSLRATTDQNHVGTISTVGTAQEATNKIINRQPLQFLLRFPYSYAVPKVVRIIYDDNLLCSGPEEAPDGNSIVTKIDLKHVLLTNAPDQPSNIQSVMHPYSEDQFSASPSMEQFDPSTIANQQTSSVSNQIPSKPAMPSPPSIHSTDTNNICGTRDSQTDVTPLIFGGEETKRGEWPWIAAIYLNKPTGLSFNCGGTLVSTKTVITAAHCINTSTKNYKPREVLIWLGRYSLTDWSENGATSSTVERVIIHADYQRKRASYDADIAILIMTKHVEFNEFIRPVCLWPDGSSIREVEGKKGTVVGWGKDENDKIVSNIPKKIDLPIVNTVTCVQTSESLYKAVSNRTFCAGLLDGDGPCHGDSGGGLTLYLNNRWRLCGIVSAGLSDANSGQCKLMDYIVFTDVSTFTSWIRTNMQS